MTTKSGHGHEPAAVRPTAQRAVGDPQLVARLTEGQPFTIAAQTCQFYQRVAATTGRASPRAATYSTWLVVAGLNMNRPRRSEPDQPPLQGRHATSPDDRDIVVAAPQPGGTLNLRGRAFPYAVSDIATGEEK